MTKVHPPVLGFNNNVRHRGRIFHIQTEDSGVKSPRIVTHLFADGGRIIKTARTDYAQHLERVDLTNVVRQMMKAQHKAMFTSLRAGELDALLESACGPLPLPPSRDSGTLAVIPDSQLDASRAAKDERAAPSVPKPRPTTNPNLRAVETPVRPTGREGAQVSVPPSELESASLPPIASTGLESTNPGSIAAPTSVRKSSPSASRKPRTPSTPTLSRPSSRYGSAPTKTAQSIFGDGVVSEKSLDEVILSYLADDLDGSSE